MLQNLPFNKIVIEKTFMVVVVPKVKEIEKSHPMEINEIPGKEVI